MSNAMKIIPLVIMIFIALALPVFAEEIQLALPQESAEPISVEPIYQDGKILNEYFIVETSDVNEIVKDGFDNTIFDYIHYDLIKSADDSGEGYKEPAKTSYSDCTSDEKERIDDNLACLEKIKDYSDGSNISIRYKMIDNQIKTIITINFATKGNYQLVFGSDFTNSKSEYLINEPESYIKINSHYYYDWKDIKDYVSTVKDLETGFEVVTDLGFQDVGQIIIDPLIVNNATIGAGVGNTGGRIVRTSNGTVYTVLEEPTATVTDAMKYDSLISEPNTDGVPNVNNQILAGDANTNLMYSTDWLFLGNINKTIYAMGIRMSTPVGTPSGLGYLYNVDICPTNVGALTANYTFGADCSGAITRVATNLSFSNLLGVPADQEYKYLPFDIPYTFAPNSTSKYIIMFSNVTPSDGDSGADNWRLRTDDAPTVNQMRSRGALTAVNDQILSIRLYDNSYVNYTMNIFKSTNDGLTWNKVASTNESFAHSATSTYRYSIGILDDIIHIYNYNNPYVTLSTFKYRAFNTTSDTFATVNASKLFRYDVNNRNYVSNLAFIRNLTKLSTFDYCEATTGWTADFQATSLATSTTRVQGSFSLNLTQSPTTVPTQTYSRLYKIMNMSTPMVGNFTDGYTYVSLSLYIPDITKYNSINIGIQNQTSGASNSYNYVRNPNTAGWVNGWNNFTLKVGTNMTQNGAGIAPTSDTFLFIIRANNATTTDSWYLLDNVTISKYNQDYVCFAGLDGTYELVCQNKNPDNKLFNDTNQVGSFVLNTSFSTGYPVNIQALPDGRVVEWGLMSPSLFGIADTHFAGNMTRNSGAGGITAPCSGGFNSPINGVVVTPNGNIVAMYPSCSIAPPANMRMCIFNATTNSFQGGTTYGYAHSLGCGVAGSVNIFTVRNGKCEYYIDNFYVLRSIDNDCLVYNETIEPLVNVSGRYANFTFPPFVYYQNINMNAYNYTRFLYTNVNDTFFDVYPSILTVRAYDQSNLSRLQYFDVTIQNSTYVQTYLNNTNELSTNDWSGDLTITVSKNGYYQNSYSRNANYSDRVELDAYLLALSEGQIVNFIVQDTANNPIQNADISAERLVGTNWVIVGSGHTDASGIKSFFLDPDVSYRITVSKSPYATFQNIIYPTLTEYYIILGGGVTVPPYNATFYNITKYQVLPTNHFINSLTPSLWSHSFELRAFNGTLSSWGLNRTLNNGAMVVVGTSTNSSGGIISATVSLPSNTLNVTLIPWFIKTDGTYYSERINYQYNNQSQYGNYTLDTVMRTLGGQGTKPTFFLSFLAIFIAVFIIATAGRYWTLGASVIAMVWLGLATFWGWFDPLLYIITVIVGICALYVTSNISSVS